MPRSLYLLGYDVSDSRTRARVLREVKCHAIGGQKSLYECWLDGDELARLRHAVATTIDPATDRAALIRLDPRATVLTLGVAQAPVDASFIFLG